MMATLAGLLWATVAAQSQYIDGELLRDPTQPAYVMTSEAGVVSGGAAPQIDRSRYELSFIRTGGDQPVAVINNQPLTIGDRVSDALVRDIRAGEVVLLIDGQELVLATNSTPIREPVN